MSSHTRSSRSHIVHVRAITLFALGGVSQIEKNPDDAKTEFWMAIAGPLTSCALGCACLGVALCCGWHPGASPAAPVDELVWLGYINVGLGIFDLVPSYPLDGGRVLHAILWWRSGNASRSTRVAARIGEGLGLLFIALGAVQVFQGAALDGIWIAFIGWFLTQAAAQSYREAGAVPCLAPLRVADVMSTGCPIVSERLNVQRFVDEEMLGSGKRCFFVEDNGAFAGLVTPHEIKRLKRSEWP